MTKHNEHIVREVLDTLYEAKGAILGLTALDTELELQIKIQQNECATTRRIDRAISAIQQLEESNPWHKVSEEKDMPKEETFMVTYPAKYYPDYCYYEKHLDKWVVNNLAYPFEKFKKMYTHWMEIPEIKED